MPTTCPADFCERHTKRKLPTRKYVGRSLAAPCQGGRCGVGCGTRNIIPPGRAWWQLTINHITAGRPEAGLAQQKSDPGARLHSQVSGRRGNPTLGGRTPSSTWRMRQRIVHPVYSPASYRPPRPEQDMPAVRRPGKLALLAHSRTHCRLLCVLPQSDCVHSRTAAIPLVGSPIRTPGASCSIGRAASREESQVQVGAE